ncbi:MAG: HAD family phosphatase [Erysipelotrichaceae bacterium]|nr:HAD family phosphatase [Erysipelotrichaceae bacterium]
MFENIRLIVADIDGTLKETADPMSAENTEALRLLHEKGIWLGLASGRKVQQLKEYVVEWGIEFPFEVHLGLNGGQIWDEIDGELIESYKLKKEWIRQIMEVMAPYEASASVYLPDKNVTLISKMTEGERASMLRNHDQRIIAKSFEDFATIEREKLCFRTDNEQEMARIEEGLSHYDFDGFRAFKTQKTVIEFMDERVSKGNALQRYCSKHNIDLEDVMAFGDTSNDNEMLKCCVGVCLADGTEDTLKIARYVTDKSCAENGFADFVKKNLL